MSNTPAHGLCFLPWLHLNEPVRVGEFEFRPVRLHNDVGRTARKAKPSLSSLGEMLPTAAADTYIKVLNSYVGPLGLKPEPQQDPVDQKRVEVSISPDIIECATIMMRPGEVEPWLIPVDAMSEVLLSAQILALACIAAQRLFEPLGPYVNSTVFRPIFQGGTGDGLGLFIRRRTGDLGIGGLEHRHVRFQAPMVAYDARPPEPDPTFINAILAARKAGAASWDRLMEALPLFLLAVSDDEAFTVEQAVMYVAMAFERQLGVNGNAKLVADALATLFAGRPRIELPNSKRAKLDIDPKFAQAQNAWPVRQKWAKELYEARSLLAHGRANPNLSQNWAVHEHLVAASFVFPLLVKLQMQAEGHYSLIEADEVACDILDRLLDAEHWGFKWDQPRQWPEILTEEINSRDIRRSIGQALDRASSGGNGGSVGAF